MVNVGNKNPTPRYCTRNKLNHNRIENQLEFRFHDNILRNFYDPDELAKYITRTINTTIIENQRVAKITRAKKQLCEWMNEEVQMLIDKRDDMRHKQNSNYSEARQKAIDDISRELSKAKKKAKREYDDNLFKDNESHKETWKKINQVLGRRKTPVKISRIITNDGIKDDPIEIVN